MNFLALIKEVADRPQTESDLNPSLDKEEEREEREEKRKIENELKSIPSIILSSSILTKSSIQRQCRRKTYLSSIISKKVMISNITDEDIYAIFKNTNRPVSDNQYLVNYLSNLQPFYDLIVESRGERAGEIIKNISFMLKFYSLNKDSIVFRCGDRDERCFIMLEGQVDIISSNEEYIKMTDKEYILYLIKLRFVYEMDLLKEIIDSNNAIFPIEERPFDNWIRVAYRTIHSLKDKKITKKGDIVDSCALITKKKTNARRKSQQNFINKTFETKKLKNLVLSLENDIINSYNQIEIDVFNVKDNKSQSITSSEFINRVKPIYSDSSFLLDLEKSVYKVKTYFISQTISKGEIFGEVLTEGIHNKVFENTKRTATAITAADTKCAYLEKEVFYELLRFTLEKLRRDKITFLFDLAIFSKVNKNDFIKTYSHYFKKKMFHDNHILFNENDSSNEHFLYFISSGQFEASCFKSMSDIDKVINDKVPEVMNEQLEKEYQRKQSFKLAIFGKNDIIGLGDCFYRGKYLYTLKCVSVNGVVFMLHSEFFQAIMNNDVTVQNKTDELLLVKINIRNKLLKQQKDVRMKSLYSRLLNTTKETKPLPITRLKLPFYSKPIKDRSKHDKPKGSHNTNTKTETKTNTSESERNQRNETSTMCDQLNKITKICQSHRRYTSRNSSRVKRQDKESNSLIRIQRSHVDKVDRMKKELLKQKTQTIKLDVSSNNNNINSNMNTLYQTKNTITFDNDSMNIATETIYNDINRFSKKNSHHSKREAPQINPLAYDDFERNYNTEYYFNMHGKTQRDKQSKYYLSLIDSTIPYHSKYKSMNQKAQLYKTISTYKTTSSPITKKELLNNSNTNRKYQNIKQYMQKTKLGV